LYESDGVDVISGPNGFEVCLWDLEYLFEMAKESLPLRQGQAIEWFLVYNLKESTVAEMMGISPSNPIGSYATAGLNNLIIMIDNGDFPSFEFEKESVTALTRSTSPVIPRGSRPRSVGQHQRMIA